MDESRPRYWWLRRFVLLLGAIVAAGATYDGAVFYSRWNRNQQAESARARAQTDQARKAIDSVGGGGLKIVSFYAAPGAIRRGDSTRICYGVTGAKTVRLEPPIGEVWPALTRCIPASPTKDTEYKFVAEDGAGHSTSESFVVKVQPALR